jgi:SAM-dependent methyltransferase
MSASEPWWATYFDPTFLRIYEPHVGHLARGEVEAVAKLLPSGGGDLLDLACGWGRHAVRLARRGFDVTGFDHSHFLLEEGRRRAASRGVEVRWVQGDMRNLPFREEFDAVVCLFSSLGYFLNDADDLSVIRGIHDALRPGGVFVLDTMHRDLIAREFAERDWWTTPDGDLVWVERDFDPVAGMSEEILRWRTSDGSSGEKRHALRVRSATEWDALLRSGGLEPVDWLGGWDLAPFDPSAPRLVVRARKVFD